MPHSHSITAQKLRLRRAISKGFLPRRTAAGAEALPPWYREADDSTLIDVKVPLAIARRIPPIATSLAIQRKGCQLLHENIESAVATTNKCFERGIISEQVRADELRLHGMAATAKHRHLTPHRSPPSRVEPINRTVLKLDMLLSDESRDMRMSNKTTLCLDKLIPEALALDFGSDVASHDSNIDNRGFFLDDSQVADLDETDMFGPLFEKMIMWSCILVYLGASICPFCVCDFLLVHRLSGYYVLSYCFGILRSAEVFLNLCTCGVAVTYHKSLAAWEVHELWTAERGYWDNVVRIGLAEYLEHKAERNPDGEVIEQDFAQSDLRTQLEDFLCSSSS